MVGKAGMVLMMLLVSASVSGSESGKGSENEGETAYAVCSACHQRDGTGIQGAFPPLRTRVTRISRLEGGREYLIGATLYGLMGEIKADGQSYFGVMPGQQGILNHAQIAAALNYIVVRLTDAPPAQILPPFTAAEVERLADSWGRAGPDRTGKLRESLKSRHADRWPE